MRLYIFLMAAALAGVGCGEGSANKSRKQKTPQEYAPKLPKLTALEQKRYHDAFAAYLQPLVRSGFNGGILIAKNGTVVYEHYTGWANHQKGDSINAETPMQIASTTKTFTGGAILQLVQENKLQLSDSLGKFFPGFPYPGITVKMLLNHRSGLPNYLYYLEGGLWDKKNFLTNADVLNTLMTLKPGRSSNPDTRFQYCNTNYVLLALIVEKLSGMPFPQYLKENIFEPLGMTHSFVYQPNDTAVHTISYNAGGGIWGMDYTDGPYGDKNIYSTPRDLLKWDQALYANKLISKALLDSAFTSYSNERPGQHNYGLGFRLLNLENGKKVIYHNGRWHGFNAAFSRLPDEKATVIILGNRYRSSIYTVARKAYNLFGDYDPGAKGFEVTE
ncbi:serine hydrolase domain-containing protein [Cnuella takakiae]|nr:serine hydrolase domain-containing protein [Cnuella takakiae]